MKLLSLVALALCAGPVFANSTFPNAPFLPDVAVADALKTFKDLSVDPMSMKQYGFQSAAEVGSCVVTAELPEFYVGLGDLASYQKGQDPQTLMKFNEE